MKTRYLHILVLAILVSSCNKKKNVGDCDFNKLEFVELKTQKGDIREDKTIFDCLQIEIDKDLTQVVNRDRTIMISWSTSSENIVEEFDINLNDEISRSFDAVDEQEIVLKETGKTWEISFKSDNESKFNGYLRLYKTTDGDYWKPEKGNEEMSMR